MLARGMHNASPLLNSTLQRAENCFTAASRVLPALCTTCPAQVVANVDLHGLFDKPNSALTTATSSQNWTKSFDSTSSGNSNLLFVSPATSIDYHDSNAKAGDTSVCQCGSLSWIECHHRQCYEEDLESFRHMLQNHICLVRDLRLSKLSKRVQQPSECVSFALHAGHGFKVNTTREWRPKSQMSTGEKLERIRIGRESGWKKERFDGTKYQALCEVALSELYATPTT